MLAAGINEWGVDQLLENKDEVKQHSTGSLADALSIANVLHDPKAVIKAMQTVADFELDDEYGFTPLMMAVLFGPSRNVERLLPLADVAQKTSCGRTALDFAIMLKRDEIAHRLKVLMRNKRTKSLSLIPKLDAGDTRPETRRVVLRNVRGTIQRLRALRKRELAAKQVLQEQLKAAERKLAKFDRHLDAMLKKEIDLVAKLGLDASDRKAHQPSVADS